MLHGALTGGGPTFRRGQRMQSTTATALPPTPTCTSALPALALSLPRSLALVHPISCLAPQSQLLCASFVGRRSPHTPPPWADTTRRSRTATAPSNSSLTSPKREPSPVTSHTRLSWAFTFHVHTCHRTLALHAPPAPLRPVSSPAQILAVGDDPLPARAV
eukprot:1299037-Rhodomonas_salina.1